MPKLGRQASLSFSHSAHMCREKWICWSCHFPLFLMFAQVGDLARFLCIYIYSICVIHHSWCCAEREERVTSTFNCKDATTFPHYIFFIYCILHMLMHAIYIHTCISCMCVLPGRTTTVCRHGTPEVHARLKLSSVITELQTLQLLAMTFSMARPMRRACIRHACCPASICMYAYLFFSNKAAWVHYMHMLTSLSLLMREILV
jgi:hypothetical protein